MIYSTPNRAVRATSWKTDKFDGSVHMSVLYSWLSVPEAVAEKHHDWHIGRGVVH